MAIVRLPYFERNFASCKDNSGSILQFAGSRSMGFEHPTSYCLFASLFFIFSPCEIKDCAFSQAISIWCASCLG